MSAQLRFTLLRKLLKAFGLSDARIEELIATIEEWTADDQAEKADAPQHPPCGGHPRHFMLFEGRQ